MALVGISKFEDEEFVSRLDPCRVVYPDFEADGRTPHSKAKQTDIEKSREQGATIFIVGALTVNVRTYITDKTGVVQELDQEGSRLIHRNGMRTLEACRFALKRWENFKDPSGRDIPITTTEKIVLGSNYTVLDDATLERLGVALISEIGEYILERNAFLQSLAKNLNGPAPQSTSSQSGTVGPVSPTSENSAAASAQ